MLDTAEARLKDHAENVANLKGRRASPRRIRGYIREQKKKIQQMEVF